MEWVFFGEVWEQVSMCESGEEVRAWGEEEKETEKKKEKESNEAFYMIQGIQGGWHFFFCSGRIGSKENPDTLLCYEIPSCR